MLKTVLAIFLGSGLGAIARYFITIGCLRYYPTFPWGTLWVNSLGALLIGFLAYWLSHQFPEHYFFLRPLLLVGVLGGFTTFSAFSLESINLLENARLLAFAFYTVGTVFGGLLLTVLGIYLAKQFFA